MLFSSLKGKPVDRLGRTGIPLGVMESAVWGQKIARLSSGDLLLLYTDGVTEAQDRYGDFFGEGRLMDALRTQRDRPVNQVLDGVIAALNRFTGDAPGRMTGRWSPWRANNRVQSFVKIASPANTPDMAAATTPKPGKVVCPARNKPGRGVWCGNIASGPAAGDSPYKAPWYKCSFSWKSRG